MDKNLSKLYTQKIPYNILINKNVCIKKIYNPYIVRVLNYKNNLKIYF